MQRKENVTGEYSRLLDREKRGLPPSLKFVFAFNKASSRRERGTCLRLSNDRCAKDERFCVSSVDTALDFLLPMANRNPK